MGWVSFNSVDGLSVRAAWKYYEEDLLFHRECSNTHVLRETKDGDVIRHGSSGRIFLIYHEVPRGSPRLCPECMSLDRAST